MKAGTWNQISTSPYLDPQLGYRNLRVAAVLSEEEFQFYLTADPGVDSANPGSQAFSPGYFGRIWEFGRLLIEDNVIELGTRKLDGDYGRPLGVFLYVVANDPQFTGRQAVIRNNVIRHVDNGSDVNGYSRAMEIYRVKDVLIQNNILRTDKDDAVTQARAIAYLTTESSIRTSSNWTPAGNLVRGAQYVPPYALAPELETTVSSDLEDVLLASFLGGGL